MPVSLPSRISFQTKSITFTFLMLLCFHSVPAQIAVTAAQEVRQGAESASANIISGQDTSTQPQPKSSTQQRPASDQSYTPPGKAGTTYIYSKPTKETQTSGSGSMIAAQANPNAHPNITHPTSDRSNKTPAQSAMLLAFHKNPHSVPFGHIFSFTNYVVISQAGAQAPQPQPAATPRGNSPKFIRDWYNIPDNKGSGAIAIVDAFHYPLARSDLNTFSSQYQLPPMPDCDGSAAPCLRIIPAQADTNCGWNGEAALDLEWAHAIAPTAKLIFVEAKSNNNDDLYQAVKTAISELKAIGGQQLSMSWGGDESQDEIGFDSTFVSGILYFASSGDVGGAVIYPSASAKVISVGGTFINTAVNPPEEDGWVGSGGGKSLYEPAPSYQHGVENIVGTTRNTPDLSADADPNSGVAVYVSTPVASCTDHPSADQYQPGWVVYGGTSLAAPMVAAMVNVAIHNRTDVASELATIYGNRKDPTRIRDIRAIESPAGGNLTLPGYDNVTGVGSPQGLNFDADPKPNPH